MNKSIVIILTALLAAGCGTDVTGWVPGVGPQNAEPAAPPNPVVLAEPDPYCRAVAHQRKMDGKAFGYDRDMLAAIEQGAYNDCEAWRNPRAPR